MKRGWAWAAAVLVAAGCSTPTNPTGPAQPEPGSLGMLPFAGTMCVPVREHHQFLIGWETLRNAATSPVTITSVDVADAHDIAVRKAWLLDIPDGPFRLVGNWVGPRPPAGTHAATLMARARPAEGAQIAGDGTVNLILRLSTAAGGRSGPADVTYTDAEGTPHYWKGGSAIVLQPGPAC